MTGLPTELIGAAWLAQTYGVMPLGRSPVVSQIGGRRATQVDNGFRSEVYTEAMRPTVEPAAHLFSRGRFRLRAPRSHDLGRRQHPRQLLRRGDAFVGGFKADAKQ